MQELNNKYITIDTGKKVYISNENIRLFKTSSYINKPYYLIGTRCYDELSTIDVWIDSIEPLECVLKFIKQEKE